MPATNYLGLPAFTDAPIPHLPDGATVTFTASDVEDLERKPATGAGFRGSRYLSVPAGASAAAGGRGEFADGGSTHTGFDTFATSKHGTWPLSSRLPGSTRGYVDGSVGCNGHLLRGKGKPVKASPQVSDPAFADRYIAESHALLATIAEAK